MGICVRMQKGLVQNAFGMHYTIDQKILEGGGVGGGEVRLLFAEHTIKLAARGWELSILTLVRGVIFPCLYIIYLAPRASPINFGPPQKYSHIHSEPKVCQYSALISLVSVLLARDILYKTPRNAIIATSITEHLLFSALMLDIPSYVCKRKKKGEL